MFNKKKQPPIKSLIAAGTVIQGKLAFTDGLRIDGTVEGDVSATGDVASLLVISESAQLTGTVMADHVIINGVVHGPVHAKTMLELQPKAKVTGDVHYTALEMHQGAMVAGQLHPSAASANAEERPTLTLAASNG